MAAPKILEKLLGGIVRIHKISVPLTLTLIFTFNTTLGAVLIQNYYYKFKIRELIAYKEALDGQGENSPEKIAERLAGDVIPYEGVDTGIKWGDLGKRLVQIGAIDEEKFAKAFNSPLDSKEYQSVLNGTNEGTIIINESNSRFVLDVLWAFGLAQKSVVYNEGYMAEKADEVKNLASTGGWTLGTKKPMEIYNKHDLISLTDEQHSVVRRIASNIYRPCCNNHTAFPDCNHGMALLGLIELMVANGYSEEKIYDLSLKVNAYWFPNQYLTIAHYLETKQNIKWRDADPKMVLNKSYSSGSGFKNIQAQVEGLPAQGGGSCGA
ncbi:MAG: hypothetical protein UU80_C0003G0025 [candidate division WWE3 bacterium GW2011_GWA1_41_8]|uniref:Uncharacterized protein n=1 Tax=candidate division WWE3 bacterium GW2011_GWA1_41_8 TaxID=1619103 RepID=A0A0G0XCX2_UNCKA|nr:MAG: hypothetical protein UU80_C0003G0025 [candidate division WWE3 bacterium GW2011_GWA1_41_8]